MILVTFRFRLLEHRTERTAQSKNWTKEQINQMSQQHNRITAISTLGFQLPLAIVIFTQRRRERRVRAIKSSILSTFCLKSTFAKNYFCHKSVKAEIATS